MQIQDKYIKRYQEIFKEKYGSEISHEKAYMELHALVSLIDAVHRHHNKQEDKTI